MGMITVPTPRVVFKVQWDAPCKGLSTVPGTWQVLTHVCHVFVDNTILFPAPPGQALPCAVSLGKRTGRRWVCFGGRLETRTKGRNSRVLHKLLFEKAALFGGDRKAGGWEDSRTHFPRTAIYHRHQSEACCRHGSPGIASWSPQSQFSKCFHVVRVKKRT